MRTRPGFLRHRYALLTLVAAGLVLSAWGLYSRTALAQSSPAQAPDRAYSTGPFQLHDGEKVRIGLLLPTVENPNAPATFYLLNGEGTQLFNEAVGPMYIVGPMYSTSFFDITYRAQSANNPKGGVFEIHSAEVPKGIVVPTEDGILIGVLLPAVQQNGKTASPLSTSMQSFNAKDETMTHSSFGLFEGRVVK